MATKRAGASAAIRRYVRDLIEVLLEADPERRREAAPGMFRSLPPAVRVRVVERLLDQLANGDDAAARREAAASLADLGPAVVPVLISKLHGARTEEDQFRLVALLGEIGKGVTPATRGEIQMDLLIALGRTRSEKVAAGIVAVQQQLRRVGADW